jgi:Putative collagen-binding domain of a collagenase
MLATATRSTYAAAARTGDGTTIIAFVPTQRDITIDMTKVAGTSAAAWWYDPRSGAATSVGIIPTTGSHVFTPPDGNDWILVLDNAALSLPAPGDAR